MVYRKSGSADRHPGMPRWVRLLVVAAVLAAVVLVVALLTGGDHGPGRHLGSVGTVSHVLPDPTAA